jgi:hypothetical protein
MKKTYIWIVAAIITVAAAVFQRITGPTYPLKGEKEISGNIVNFKLIRSAETEKDVVISVPSIKGYNAYLVFKRYKTTDSLRSILMLPDAKGNLTATLPSLPAAGKYVYNVHYQNQQNLNEITVLSEKDVIIRFKGSVPIWILVLHILFIFSAMLFSNFTGIIAWRKDVKALLWSKITILFFVIGKKVYY